MSLAPSQRTRDEVVKTVSGAAVLGELVMSRALANPGSGDKQDECGPESPCTLFT